MEPNDKETVGKRPVIINCQCNCNGESNSKWLLAITDGNSHKGRETVGLLIRAERRRYNSNGKNQ